MSTSQQILEICYQDNYMVAINKPAGMLCHKSSIDPNELINAMYSLRDQLGQLVFPVHRLDKPTSGVLLFALDTETASKLTDSFTNRKVEKKYLAIVRGFLAESETINYPLKKLIDKKDKHQTKENPPQEAITSFKCLQQTELPFHVGRYQTSRYSLVEVQPQTGRQRQIRRHFKHIFHPIVGDTAHGDGKHNHFFRDQFDCHRLLLHAKQLSFKHPYTNQIINIEAQLDAKFNDILKKIFDKKLIL